jgi:DNA-binding transcriptional ArsR family regulator
MKSQDIFLLLKLVSIAQQEKALELSPQTHLDNWKDWDEEAYSSDPLEEPYFDASNKSAPQYSIRALADATGISKSEVSQALQRCYEVGLAKLERGTAVPRVNSNALSEFILHGLRYVFPAKPAEITRGIATAWAAPVLQDSLMSAGDIIPVWADARGNTKGQAITPLFKSVPAAVKKDKRLYALLALTDAIRIGLARERKIASEKLESMLKES